MLLHDREHLRHRSQLPRRVRADLATRRAARPARRAPAHRHLPRRQRHARLSSSCPTPTRSAPPTLPGLPVGFHLPDLGRQLHAASRASFSCAAGCAAASPPRCSTPILIPSTMMPPRRPGSRHHQPRKARVLADAVRTAARRSAPTQSSTASTSATIAQNWLDLRAERSLSRFDQRHLLNLQIAIHQRRGTRRRNADEWLARPAAKGVDRRSPQFTAGTGLPETPIYLAAVPALDSPAPSGPTSPAPRSMSRATGRASQPSGLHRACARASGELPASNSITGPDQFTLDARSRAPSAPARASTSMLAWTPPTC